MLDTEFKQLALENARVITNTKFNGQELLTGSGGTAGEFTFQVGANTSVDNQITVSTLDIASAMGSGTQGAGTTATLGASAGNARSAMDNIDAAIKAIGTSRATFGAAQNRFDAVISNLQVASENQAAARGRIMDADFATETANLSRTQILQQAGTAMLAQANSLPQNVLSLLR